MANMRISREDQRRASEEYKLVGVHCASCKRILEEELSRIPGIVEATVDPSTSRLRLVLEPEADRSAVLAAIRRLGYDMHVETLYVRIQKGLDAGIAESKVKSIPGVVDASYNQVEGTLRIEFDPEKLSQEDLMKKLELLGMKVESYEETSTRTSGDKPLALAAASLLVYAVSRIAGFELGEAVGGLLALAAALESFIVPAVKAALRGYTTMDTLLSIGVLASIIGSIYTTIAGGPPYWDAAVLITFFVLLGRKIEARLRRRAEEIIEGARKILPDMARVLRNGRVVEVPADKVAAGERVIVAAGERIPVDGRIESGEALVDESIITGESVPAKRRPGDLVLAGSLVVRGTLQVTALRTGRYRLVERTLESARQASLYKPRIQRIADRVASLFTPVVLTIAILALGYHTLIAGLPVEEALLYSIAVMVVSCPCAFGIAIPAALASAVAAAHRRGVIIRSPDALDSIARAKIIAFDKTGTLTLGRPRVVDVKVYSTQPDPVMLAASLESASSHPIARAIVSYYREKHGRDPPPPKEAEEIPGLGIIGVVDRHNVAVGGRKMLEAYNIDPPTTQDAGVHVIVDGKLAATIIVVDPPRPEAPATVERLIRMGLEPHILSGDDKTPVLYVAEKVGIPKENVKWSLDPAEKAATIRILSKKAPVIYVGDGVNDAPAMAEASAAVAVNVALDIAKSAADAVIAVDKITPLAQIVELARSTKRTIIGNIVWAFAYNVALIPVAAGVLAGVGLEITPGMAAAAMSLSSITVTANSVRLLLKYS